MWTKEHRERQKQFERQRYSTDLSDAEWEHIHPLLPPAARRGRTITVDLREVLNALRYLARTGCGWGLLPVHFPPWPTVYWWFRKLLRRFLFQTIHDTLVMIDRETHGREASPTAGVLDSQTVKAPNAPGGGGYDAGKKIKGRKRHITVDTAGLLLGVLVHAADIQDADGAGDLLTRIKRLYGWLKAVFADSIYNRLTVILACFLLGLTLIIVRRIAGGGFIVVPRRWVVERSFGWLGRWRRLSKDYEECTDAAEAMVSLAFIRLMLHRLVPPN